MIIRVLYATSVLLLAFIAGTRYERGGADDTTPFTLDIVFAVFFAARLVMHKER